MGGVTPPPSDNGWTFETQQVPRSEWLRDVQTTEVDPKKYAGEGWFSVDEYFPQDIDDSYVRGDIKGFGQYYPPPDPDPRPHTGKHKPIGPQPYDPPVSDVELQGSEELEVLRQASIRNRIEQLVAQGLSEQEAYEIAYKENEI